MFFLNIQEIFILDCRSVAALQSKLDSLPVEDTVSAQAWQPSTDDDDNDESPSEPLVVTLPTTDPGSTSLCFVSNIICSLSFQFSVKSMLATNVFDSR